MEREISDLHADGRCASGDRFTEDLISSGDGTDSMKDLFDYEAAGFGVIFLMDDVGDGYREITNYFLSIKDFNFRFIGFVWWGSSVGHNYLIVIKL